MKLATEGKKATATIVSQLPLQLRHQIHLDFRKNFNLKILASIELTRLFAEFLMSLPLLTTQLELYAQLTTSQ